MNPEQTQQIDEHIKRVVGQVHESYLSVTSSLAKQVAEANLDVNALSHQNQILQKQAEATAKQLEGALQELSEAKNELEALRPVEPK